MSLSTYKKKRSFNKTPEPAGKKKASNGELHFVVQKHDASHLHYDFRLEMEGVLKSWAVPKGPSMNPEDKRLAMMVEDHPYDYKDFEGIIPEGNYGAGTVIVWDEGTYTPAGSVNDGKDPEKNLLHQLHKGALKIKLNGQKLKGEFALVQNKSRGENAWLLIKKNDKFAKAADITKKDKSVVSGMNIDQVASESTNEWISNRKSSSSQKTKKAVASKAPAKAARKAATKKKAGPRLTELIKQGKRSSMPSGIIPMFATLTDEPFNDAGWFFEIKWDGYRAVAYVQKGKAEILSRKNLSFNAKFTPVVQALKELPINAVLDGEIVAINEEGKADFQLLQQWQKNQRGELVYYVFDILWLEGYNVMDLTLQQRKEILQQYLPVDNAVIRFSDHVAGKGNDFFEAAAQSGLEGIMAKQVNSTYAPGVRTKQWLKIKTAQRQEVVIGGFTETRGSRKHFGALVLGIYNDNNELVYAGHTGSGFNEQSLGAVYKKLKPLVTKKSPFVTRVKTNMPVTWVNPKLVCEIKFSEWTKDNIMRIPVFMGLREDKDPKDVRREKAIHADPDLIEKQSKQTKAMKQQTTKKKAASKNTAAAATKKTPKTPKSTGAKTTEAKDNLLNDSEKEQVVIINKKELTFTNLDKLYWPSEKITKRDMLNYYYRMAPYIMPYLKDRPQSLNRYPDGIKKPGFYQKDVGGKVASWIETHDYRSESDGEIKKFLVCTNEATLLYMANLGCIEMHPWHSTTKKPDNPSWCVIDLDPGNISFDKVIETALVIKQITDDLEIETWCKTSGSTGLHIYIPLDNKYDYDQSRQLAELLVTMVHQEIPSFTSLERSPAKRKNKIYLDFLQNRTIQTIAAPYSLRPKPGATVSAPLHWEEVKKGMTIQDFDMFNIYDRVQEIGDIFKPVLGKGIDLKKVLSELG